MAFIEITIIDDTVVESTETFMVKLVRVIGGAKLGEETAVVISIPANDSPFGRFGFEELMVNNIHTIHISFILPFCSLDYVLIVLLVIVA